MGIKKRRIWCRVRILRKSLPKSLHEKSWKLSYIVPTERWKGSSFLNFHADCFTIFQRIWNQFFDSHMHNNTPTPTSPLPEASVSWYVHCQIMIIWGFLTIILRLWSSPHKTTSSHQQGYFLHVKRKVSSNFFSSTINNENLMTLHL